MSTVTTEKGTVETLDTGALTFVPDGLSPFETTAVSVDGTGTRRYRNADSVFVATGELDFFTGNATGTYTLDICHTGQ